MNQAEFNELMAGFLRSLSKSDKGESKSGGFHEEPPKGPKRLYVKRRGGSGWAEIIEGNAEPIVARYREIDGKPKPVYANILQGDLVRIDTRVVSYADDDGSTKESRKIDFEMLANGERFVIQSSLMDSRDLTPTAFTKGVLIGLLGLPAGEVEGIYIRANVEKSEKETVVLGDVYDSNGDLSLSAWQDAKHLGAVDLLNNVRALHSLPGEDRDADHPRLGFGVAPAPQKRAARQEPRQQVAQAQTPAPTDNPIGKQGEASLRAWLMKHAAMVDREQHAPMMGAVLGRTVANIPTITEAEAKVVLEIAKPLTQLVKYLEAAKVPGGRWVDFINAVGNPVEPVTNWWQTALYLDHDGIEAVKAAANEVRNNPAKSPDDYLPKTTKTGVQPIAASEGINAATLDEEFPPEDDLPWDR